MVGALCVFEMCIDGHIFRLGSMTLQSTVRLKGDRLPAMKLIEASRKGCAAPGRKHGFEKESPFIHAATGNVKLLEIQTQGSVRRVPGFEHGPPSNNAAVGDAFL